MLSNRLHCIMKGKVIKIGKFSSKMSLSLQFFLEISVCQSVAKVSSKCRLSVALLARKTSLHEAVLFCLQVVPFAPRKNLSYYVHLAEKISYGR